LNSPIRCWTPVPRKSVLHPGLGAPQGVGSGNGLARNVRRGTDFPSDQGLGKRPEQPALAARVSSLLANALERRAVGLAVHEPARASVPLRPDACLRVLHLGALPYGTLPVSITRRGILRHWYHPLLAGRTACARDPAELRPGSRLVGFFFSIIYAPKRDSGSPRNTLDEFAVISIAMLAIYVNRYMLTNIANCGRLLTSGGGNNGAKQYRQQHPTSAHSS